MTQYDWSGGQLLPLAPGDTASCRQLNQGQLYGLFFYNTAGGATDAIVTVVWSNSQAPVQVTVPGTTGNLGRAAVVFVSGDDTAAVSAALTGNQPGAQVQAFIGSQKMPTNPDGINNQQLAFNNTQAFTKFSRFYAVPEQHWYQVQLNSSINQFMAVCFTSMSAATVTILNAQGEPGEIVVPVGNATTMVKTLPVHRATSSYSIQGNGQQFVWMNADSTQDSRQATISVQSLSKQYELQDPRVTVSSGAR